MTTPTLTLRHLALAALKEPRSFVFAEHENPSTVVTLCLVPLPGTVAAGFYAVHRDHEGSWTELAAAGDVLDATGEESLMSALGAAQFESGTFVSPNRFNDLAMMFPAIFHRL